MIDWVAEQNQRKGMSIKSWSEGSNSSCDFKYSLLFLKLFFNQLDEQNFKLIYLGKYERIEVLIREEKYNIAIPFVMDSFEHDFIEEESVVDRKELSTKPLTEELALSEHGSIVWNAKVDLFIIFLYF